MRHDGKKEIRFTKHAQERFVLRGTNEEEIIRAIEECEWHVAKDKKLECKKGFLFNSIWGEKFYAIKEVRPIFVNEENVIVVISVYTYFN